MCMTKKKDRSKYIGSIRPCLISRKCVNQIVFESEREIFDAVDRKKQNLAIIWLVCKWWSRTLLHALLLRSAVLRCERLISYARRRSLKAQHEPFKNTGHSEQSYVHNWSFLEFLIQGKYFLFILHG